MNTRVEANRPITCPCCGSETLSARGKFEICPVCGWEDDPLQSADPALEGGANLLSLDQARTKYASRRSGPKSTSA